ncbi:MULTISPECIES: glycoside hydrolase family 3 protein [unclassified Fusibacter]|uniref:glycoside hydrolase family 3 protein n=1 Tax=unclassified Fusibacter TaxID=2624464 RepID=UPI001010424B|nr:MULTISPECIES: glycoside hydrolase family 3 protein [unclassified Fusibacter]MCK8060355.1 glycoside hydrolase family 3 protein [Fusibacter sp. A2]NPE20356.1 glycoside hydrolase family 3 protein [Fusibacter sp. A1]RXV63562.1 beta-glucosidase [Fusibacter sp. A1]
MKKWMTCLTLIAVLLMGGCGTSEVEDEVVPVDDETAQAQEERGKILIESLEDIDRAIKGMTLEEKAGQMIQAERSGIQLSEISKYNIGSVLSGGGSVPTKNTPEGWMQLSNRMQKVSRNSSSGIPLIYGIDAVHGHNNVLDAVIYPHNIGLGAANNPALMHEIGKAVAKDIKATGIQWNFAPAVSIVQDIRWGRTYESYSEVTGRVSVLGSEYIKGLQGEGVVATTKHFIGDGFTTFGTGEGENLIDRGDVTADYQVLLNMYLPAYEQAIASGTKTIMASFNSVNGVKMHGHKTLLTDVLRTQLGFEGVVISDWEAIDGLEGTLEDRVASAIDAGIDMLMQPFNWKEVYEAILSGVENGKISEDRIDEAVKRILVLKFEAGLFEPFTEKSATDLGTDEAKALARKAVSESVVLLKNEEVLPLDSGLKIYLVGPASDNVGIQCGGWTLSWQGEMTADLNQGTSIKEAFEAELAKGGGRLVKDPEEADLVILVIGEKPYAEMNGDTADLSLDGPLSLEDNLAAVKEVKKYDLPVVTIMVAGRPLLVKDHIGGWDAFVMAWLPGTEGAGITDVLFGQSPFKGTLPVTWPIENEQASDSALFSDYDRLEHQYKYGDGIIDN